MHSRFGPFGSKRDPATISQSEILVAAWWWAANTISMPEVDPWRSHLFCIPFAALLAPNASDLAAWLEAAHKSVCGASLTVSVYATAKEELLSTNPPWSAKNRSEGANAVAQRTRDKVEGRLDEMQRLLNEIRRDSTIEVGSSTGVFTL